MSILNHNLKVTFLFFIYFVCVLTSYSQTIGSEFSNYCDGDSVDLILNYDSEINSIIWQNNMDGDWNEITDILIYEGLNNDTLTINNVNSSFNEVLFRTLLDTGDVGGFEDTSQVYMLIVFDDLTTPIIQGSQSICYNTIPEIITLTTISGGSGSFSYQWFKDGEAISGASSPNYQASALTSSATYSLEVSDECNTILSNSIIITVFEDLSIDTLLGDQDICFNTSISQLTSPLVTGGTDNYYYQWYQDGVSIPGAESTTLQIDGLTESHDYYVEVYDYCGAVISNSIHINVYSDLTPGFITSNQTICYNTEPLSLTFSQLPFGGEGSHSYQWQSFSGSSWTDIAGANSTTYSPSSLAEDTQFRVQVSDMCGTVFTDPVAITVYDDLTTPVIIGAQSICYNTSPNIMSLSSVFGGAGNYSYQWFQDGEAITGATNSIYQAPLLTSSASYTLQVSDPCAVKLSNAITITVFEDFSIGTLLGDQDICFNTSMSQLTAPTVTGGTENYFYQWYEDGIVIPGEESTILQIDGLTESHNYYVEAYDYCDAVISNSIHVNVYSDLTPGSITSPQTICYNTVPLSLIFSQLPFGGEGSHSYQWQSFSGSSWTDIAGANSTTYSPSSLAEDTQFRVQVSDMCGTVFTDPVAITVYDDLTTPVIIGAQSICYNTSPNIMSLSSVFGGAGNYSYQWFQDGEAITGATNSIYQAPLLTSSASYTLQVSDPCAVKLSNAITITVFEDFSIGTLLGDQDICFNTSMSQLTAPTVTGGTENYFYQWYEDGVVIPGEESSTLQISSLTESHDYFVEASDYCDAIISNPIHVNVYFDLTPGSITSPQTICYNTVPSSLTFSQLPFGGEGSHSYQWQSFSGSGWSDISAATSTTYSPSSLTEDISYRVQVSDPCGTVFTNSIIVDVYDEFQIDNLVGDTTLCYNESMSILTAPVSNGGAPGISYQWYENNSIIEGANENNYYSGTLTESIQYNVDVINSCNTLNSNTIQCTVHTELIPGEIIGATTICYNSSPSDLFLDTYPIGGGGGPYSYQWQQSLNGNNSWQDLEGETDVILSLGPLNYSKYYRLSVISSPFQYSNFCGPKFTNAVFIEVKADLSAGIITSQSICYDTSTIMEFEELPSGGYDNFSYQWQSSTDGSLWSNVGSNITSYSTPTLTESVLYRVRSTDICGQIYTVSTLLNVYDTLQAGSIISQDTLCFNSSLDNPLNANFTPPSGGDLSYSYQWYYSELGGEYYPLASSSFLPLYDMAESANIYVDYISGSNCGTVSSNILELIVLDEVYPGSIYGDTTICYSSSPEIFGLDQYPEGGGDVSYSYQWQELNVDEEWVSIADETTEEIDVGTLLTSNSYRLSVTSDVFGCGPKYTNQVEIQVLDEFLPGQLYDQDPICFNTIPQQIDFESPPSGANEDYSYNWVVLDDGNWVLLNEFGQSYQPNQLTESSNYQVFVTSEYGCGTVWSNDVEIVVYDSLQTGLISNVDPICYDEVPGSIIEITSPIGGDGTYTYEWFESEDQINWNSIGGDNVEYQSGALVETTYFYLNYTSGSDCGTVSSNIMELIVNPLPDTVQVLGPAQVCSNQSYVEYTLSETNGDLYYNWSINSGEFMGSSQDFFAIIHFDNAPQEDMLYVEQTFTNTGCTNTMSMAVEVSENVAPDIGVVIKKPDANILITSDSTLYLNYSWGFTEKLTNNSTNVPSILRYALMPHLDVDTYWYWVDTYFDDNCSTRSYYNSPPLPTDVFDEEVFARVYPNPTSGVLSIEVLNFQCVYIYNMSGKEVLHTFKNNDIDLSTLHPGLYIARTHTLTGILTCKIIIE